MDGLMGAPVETRRRESEGAERIVSQLLLVTGRAYEYQTGSRYYVVSFERNDKVADSRVASETVVRSPGTELLSVIPRMSVSTAYGSSSSSFQ